MLDNLSHELFLNSPTFRGQMSAAFTVVAVERWKAASAIVIGVNALEAAGVATSEHLIARKLASTEVSFLRKALATQGIYLDDADQPQMMISGTAAGDSAARDGISKLINQMLASPGSSWTWSVSDWMASQATASQEIATHLNTMLSAMVAVPAGVGQQVQADASALSATQSKVREAGA